VSWARCRTILSELKFDVQLELLRWRERKALVQLGAAAGGDLPRDPGFALLLDQIGAVDRKVAELRRSFAMALEADRSDFSQVSSHVRPIVVLRGLCTRAILRHQIAALQRSLSPTHEALARELMRTEAGRARLAGPVVGSVLRLRTAIDRLLEERRERLAPFGGTALPGWFPHAGGEARKLGRSVWQQLRPNVLPRFPAFAGLVVGWWIADTYTSSHFKSVLHSLGIGSGGKRVVSGDTYRAMLFWLPILAAGLCAYLADRAKVLIQSRYVKG
jgi:hypothetical protein